MSIVSMSTSLTSLGQSKFMWQTSSGMGYNQGTTMPGQNQHKNNLFFSTATIELECFTKWEHKERIKKYVMGFVELILYM